MVPIVEAAVILLLPREGGVIVGDRAVAIVGETHRADAICPILPGAITGNRGIGAHGLIACRLPCVGEIEGRDAAGPTEAARKHRYRQND